MGAGGSNQHQLTATPVQYGIKSAGCFSQSLSIPKLSIPKYSEVVSMLSCPRARLICSIGTPAFQAIWAPVLLGPAGAIEQKITV